MEVIGKLNFLIMKNGKLLLPVLLWAWTSFLVTANLNLSAQSSPPVGPSNGPPELAFGLLKDDTVAGQYPGLEVYMGNYKYPLSGVTELKFSFVYDTLYNLQEFDFSNYWFNMDGSAQCQFIHQVAQKRLIVALTRLTPVSGFGPVYKHSGVGIIDVIEVRVASGGTQLLNDRVEWVTSLPGSTMSVYPSCANENFTLELERSARSVSLISASGQTVSTLGSLEVGSHRLDVANLPDGIYFLKGIFEQGILTRKLIIAHR